MEKNVFFKNEKERNLWIRLNAERIRYGNMVINNIKNNDLGAIDKPYSPLWVSNNQLKFDEENRDIPRLSLEELSTLTQDELLRISRKRNCEIIKELFGELENREDEF